MRVRRRNKKFILNKKRRVGTPPQKIPVGHRVSNRNFLGGAPMVNLYSPESCKVFKLFSSSRMESSYFLEGCLRASLALTKVLKVC